MQAGELLHRLKLRGDPFDTGPPVARLDPNLLENVQDIFLKAGPVFLQVLDLDILIQIHKLASTSKEWNVLFTNPNYEWEFVKKWLLPHLIDKSASIRNKPTEDALDPNYSEDDIYFFNKKKSPLHSERASDPNDSKYSIYDIYKVIYNLNWEDAIHLLRSTIPTADEDTLKNVANVALNIDLDSLNENTVVDVKQLRKIATCYPLTQKPFEIGYWQLKFGDTLIYCFVIDPEATFVTKALSVSAAMKVFSTAISNGALAALKFLFLPMGQIGDEEMRDFSTALESKALPSLTQLWLPNNNIGEQGMKAFSAALSSGALANLTELLLGTNNIGDNGARY